MPAIKDKESGERRELTGKEREVIANNIDEARSRRLRKLRIAENNGAASQIIATARPMAFRHLPRTQRIDVRWLPEVCSHPRARMRYCNTKQQIADLMAKGLNSPATWEHYWTSRK